MPDVLHVALPLPRPALFDYATADGRPASADWVGCRVIVRLGPRRLLGVVAAVGPARVASGRLRAIEQRLDPQPLWPEEIWASLRWLAGYYHAALGEVLALALPAGLRRGDAVLDPIRYGWRRLAGAALPRLKPGGRPQQLWQQLAFGPLAEEALDQQLPDWRPAARGLLGRGLIERLPLAEPSWQPRPGRPLNPAQVAAAAAIRPAAGFVPLLLDGVTGSGKTEVYLDALVRCLAAGRQALVLVPEIALTPQTERRFRERLGDAVRVMHSAVSDGERGRIWAEMASAAARVVIGTRSAVFLPLPRAGLIVVDEEHDSSYKQQDGVRYSARDFALYRARQLAVPIVLGSATPALETLALVERGRLQRLRLPERAGAARPPRVEVLDLRRQRLDGGLAAPALAALRQTLDAGGQALVFRNRRGFAPALLCHDCGWVAGCERCERPLTVFRGGARLRCHHCGAQRPAPPACPDCGGLGLQPQGVGTERLEQVLRQALPDWPLFRIDRDTASGRDAVGRLLAELGDRPGLLVGTQMLAKGHDLPKLDLVLVVGLDEGLFSADFRASERLAQLLIQVAGRAGRGERPGRVILQTHHPQHPLLTTLLTGGYPAFAQAALAERAILGFPPYAHLALWRAEAAEAAPADAFLQQIAELAAAADPSVERLGPLPAPHPRRAGQLRRQLLLRSAQRGALQRLLDRLWPAAFELPSARKVRWGVEVDPVDLY